MNMNHTLSRINVVFLMTLLSISFAGCNKSHATREINSTVETAARQSENIVLARCTGNKIEEAETGLIFTVTTFSVEQIIKGDVSDDTISVRLPGGQKGEVKVNVPDSPEFIEKEDVILFLGNKAENGYYTLQSFSDGVYRVLYDESSQSRYISSPLDNMTIYNSTTGKEVTENKKVSLENFIFSIKRMTKE